MAWGNCPALDEDKVLNCWHLYVTIFLCYDSNKMAEDVPRSCAALFSLVLVIHTKLAMFFIDLLRFAMSVSENHLNIWGLTDLQVLWPADPGWDK